MDIIDSGEARKICHQLMNTPQAPGVYSHFINVGTDAILNSLEKNYFRDALSDGISCFKYLQGDYGAGKTQFINCLADRAWQHNIVTSIVAVGNECPFNSPAAIYRAIVSSFLPPPNLERTQLARKGIEILIESWIKEQLVKRGWTPGQEIDQSMRAEIERTFNDIQLGVKDMQAEAGMRALGRAILGFLSGVSHSVADGELISWMRGDKIQSTSLKHAFGLHEPVNDQNAFNRLKTVVGFLRERLGFRGFLIAFDEGTRTASFRRGSTKQKQAIENMLTMINENAEGEFSGVMFLYAATPDFRNDVISKYTALNDRIGNASFSPGRPLVPFIDLDDVNTDEVIRQIGERLLEVFAKAYSVTWDLKVQQSNLTEMFQAEKAISFKVIPRAFVYHCCMFLDLQRDRQHLITQAEARDFVSQNEPPREAQEDEAAS